jgi:ComF family protein
MILRRALRLAKLVPGASARSAVAGWAGALARAIDDLLFPWSCAACGAEGSGGALCPTCRAALLDWSAKASASVCPRCALPAGPYADLRRGCGDCRGRSLGFEAAVALGPYDGTLRELCLRMKRDRDAWLAPWLCDLWVESRGAAIARLELPPDAWVVPVPLHWRRHWERGYNQAEALARGLARRLDRPVRHPLRRVVYSGKLATMSATDRAKALGDAFRARKGGALEGRTILLVDDVLTTGATCGAAARALKKAGAARVIVAVMARTGKTYQ